MMVKSGGAFQSSLLVPALPIHFTPDGPQEPIGSLKQRNCKIKVEVNTSPIQMFAMSVTVSLHI
jgi:hypothetical protein